MGKGKKPFIDRKNAVTFHLVHRSQRDPLVTDETAPQRVLVEAPQKNKTNETTAPTPTTTDPNKRKEELQTYGIFYDDDYDYLQHLRKREEDIVWEYAENPNQARKNQKDGKKSKPKINLPSSVFASEYEEDIGMLNKAAPHPGPRPDWDPDVVERLDDDFDVSDNESELSDDFIAKAMASGDELDDEDDDGEFNESDEERDFDSDDLNDDEDEDDSEGDEELMDKLGPLLRERRFADEETKSRFTEYSMSSSVIRRNEQLSLLDDRFEHFYASYDDPELGDLAMEDIEGSWHEKHPYVMDCYKEFKKDKKVEPYNKDWDKERIEKFRSVVDGDIDPNEELIEHEVKDPKQKKWDCESILSTYSNIYNHPKIIDEPKRRRKSDSISSSNAAPQATKIEIDPKTGLPTNVLRGGDSNQLTAKALSRLEDSTIGGTTGPKSLCAKSVLSTLSVLSIRPKDETTEEKHERKRLLKEYRKERRIERKANTDAFKEEKKRQTHVKINQHCNQQGKKIV